VRKKRSRALRIILALLVVLACLKIGARPLIKRALAVRLPCSPPSCWRVEAGEKVKDDFGRDVYRMVHPPMAVTLEIDASNALILRVWDEKGQRVIPSPPRHLWRKDITSPALSVTPYAVDPKESEEMRKRWINDNALLELRPGQRLSTMGQIYKPWRYRLMDERLDDGSVRTIMAPEDAAVLGPRPPDPKPGFRVELGSFARAGRYRVQAVLSMSSTSMKRVFPIYEALPEWLQTRWLSLAPREAWLLGPKYRYEAVSQTIEFEVRK
jgi:hypothetical protein